MTPDYTSPANPSAVRPAALAGGGEQEPPEEAVKRSPVRMALVQASARVFIVDMYAALFHDWAAPTPESEEALKPYLPDYATHLRRAKEHATSWETNLRPQYTGLISNLQAFYSSFVDPTTEAAMRAALNVMQDSNSTEEQIARAKQELGEILDPIIQDVNSHLTDAKSTASLASTLSTQITNDSTALKSDYDKLLQLEKSATDLSNEISDLESQRSTEIAELSVSSTTLALGTLGTVFGIVAVVCIGGAAELASGGTATPALAAMMSVTGLAAGAAIGSIAGVAGSATSLSKTEKLLEQKNSELTSENAAIAAASSLKSHFSSFSAHLGELHDALAELSTELNVLPQDLSTLRGHAVAARFGDVDTVLKEMVELKNDYETLNSDVSKVEETLTTFQVEQVDSPDEAQSGFQVNGEAA